MLGLFDGAARSANAAPFAAVARYLDKRNVSANTVTAFAVLTGLASAVAAGYARWWLALLLWLFSRLLDGLDGPLARLRGATDFGWFADTIGDLTVFGAFAFGVAVALPDARLAATALILGYYLESVAIGGFTIVSGRMPDDDVRTHSSIPRRNVWEGTDTIAGCGLIALFPGVAAWIMCALAFLLTATAVQYALYVRSSLSQPSTTAA